MRYFQFKEFKFQMKTFVKKNPTTFKVFHHGDCLGADAQAHGVARELGFWIVVHPPEEPRGRAFCDGDVILPEKPFLVRNRDIVDASHLVLAAPKTAEEVLRSGTWATIRYARNEEKVLRVLQP